MRSLGMRSAGALWRFHRDFLESIFDSITPSGSGKGMVLLAAFLVKDPGIAVLTTGTACNGCWGVDNVRLRRVESILCALRSLASSIFRLDSVSRAGDAVAVLGTTVVVTCKSEGNGETEILGGGTETGA